MTDSLAMLKPTGVAPLLQPGVGSATAASEEGGADFTQMLASMARDAVTTVKTGEAVAMAGMQGQASVQQVVEAVMQAEQTMQTMVAVRDKVVGAYLEISRMQI